MRYFAAVLVVISYLLLCLMCWMRYRQRQQLTLVDSATDLPQEGLLVAYASQTGKAETIARQSAAQLLQAGLKVKLLPLNKLDTQTLTVTRQALFIVSTYGEGEAPDNGASFLRRYLAEDSGMDLTHLRFAILALGDRDYRHFCGFGHALDHGLHHHGASSLFDLVEVDKDDESVLRHWQYYLGQLSGQTHFADWSKPRYLPWRLQQRVCLNPHSPGNPAFHIRLLPVDGEPGIDQWQAGDIAEIGPCNPEHSVENFLQVLSLDGNVWIPDMENRLETVLQRRELPEDDNALQALRNLSVTEIVQQLPELPHREYSIASLPQDGTLDLLVRQVKITDKKLGLGSGWLTEYAQLHHEIALRIRTNSRFHSPEDDRPLILIGNGTGLAGLRAHLRARAQQGHSRNWLLFGERTLANDFFFSDEILAWKINGHLTFLDLAFSRDQLDETPDQARSRYVQHLLLQRQDEVKRWIEEGAAVYVCGSLHGMAQGVDDVLGGILGKEVLETLTDSGRYCRDVY